ncbi:hypothetical protein BU23DRAFT_444702 [Bimuria novae-zelandiae CBS 107.79]|uniref:T6SS Phospholipase effector Tle1-like catalytic domain-containing protein n=1 Tax=Bimuria novae-zelandiae CBS 107.79 TaxID=1447943 RepID=A0A6A5VV78_9PLEO|nr:hypothetical protein BU23DRAFT_444702 [Bimuria novae-zelandiae CBS 107.79]
MDDVNAYNTGVHAVVQDAYYFLCLNYEIDISETHLVGFSRGAFAARALACLIEEVGLLKRSWLACLPMVYELWMSEGAKLSSGQMSSEESKLRDHVKTWQKKNHVIRPVTVSTCAVWDTVNSMRSGELDFVENIVPCHLKHAFHCLALHEISDDFLPVLWNAPSKTNVRECWFIGDYSDVGGGFADSTFATLTLI